MNTMADTEKKLTELINWLGNDRKSTLSESLVVRDTSYGGRGIFAKEALTPRQQIIKISPSYLLNFSTVVAHILSWSNSINKTAFKLPETEGKEDSITEFYTKLDAQTLHRLTSFQIVTMYISLEKKRGSNSWWTPFLKSLPPFTDFVLSPLVWLLKNEDRESLPFASLPPTTKAHAEKMFIRFTTDYQVVSKLLSSTHSSNTLFTRDDFLWAWFCVNSRCLHMSIPEAHTKDDNFTMAPFVDFINHSPEDHCSLQVDHNGFHVLSSLNYKADEEIYLSYGPHSNEFLLCEYGFMLPRGSNQWNDIDLTEKITELLSEHQCEFLKESGYWGEYTISLDSVSFRLEVALAVLLEKEGNLHQNRRLQALINGVSDGKFYNRKANAILEGILDELKEELETELEKLGSQKKEKTIEDTKGTLRSLYDDQLLIVNHHLDILQ